MVSKRADSLPAWEADKGTSGNYGPNSVVWYQKTPDSAGYAYRAKSTYQNSSTPPDEDDNWEIDYTFAPPWKADGKYKIGSRVYYFNGQHTYTYVASKRYFGGSGKPNEEVDEDNIRTWELEVNYLNQNNGINGKEILIPVRKKCGYDGVKSYPFNPLGAEERLIDIYYDNNGYPQSVYGTLIAYLTQKGTLKSDYSDLNSIYQGFAYDNLVYNFYQDKPDANGVFLPRKKGTHYAKWYKELYPNQEFYSAGDRQLTFTQRNDYSSYYFFYNNSYVSFHGFAIEIWPNINDEDFMLVPTQGFWNYNYYYYYNYYSNNALPSYYNWLDGPYMMFGLFLYGGDTDRNTGNPIPSYPPDEQCKISQYFSRSNNAFTDKIVNAYLLVETTELYWKEIPIYATDQFGNTYISGYYYNMESKDPTYTVDKVSSDSKEESYKFADGIGIYLIRDKNTNPIDLSSYKKPAAYTGITMAGFSIE